MKDFFDSKLYIIKIQNWMSRKTKSRFTASFFILFVPSFIIGFILQKYYNYNVLSREIIISLLWLAIAPLLIQDSFIIFNNFFNSHTHLLNSTKKWNAIKEEYLGRFQSRKFIILELIWALSCTSIITLILFTNAPVIIQVWSFTVYFILFFLSTTGIRGMILMTRLISYLCKIKIKIDPLHYDYFGGIESFGKFIIQGTFYFSTGALIFPLVFSLLKSLSPEDFNIILLVYVQCFIFGLKLLI